MLDIDTIPDENKKQAQAQAREQDWLELRWAESPEGIAEIAEIEALWETFEFADAVGGAR